MRVVCEKCGRKFKNQRGLDQHKRRNKNCDEKYQCPKCLNYFQSNSLLERHLSRKTPCAPDEVPVIVGDNEENRCQFCNRTYSSKSNLKRHQQTCDKETNMNVIAEIMKTQMKQIAALTDEVKSLKEQNAGQIVNVDNRTINNQLNINILAFPLQDMSQVDMKQVLRIVDEQPKNQIIPAIVEHLHGNPDYPEGHNVYMTTINSDVTIVYSETEESPNKKTWHAVPYRHAFDHLKNEAMGILTHKNQPRPNYQLLEAAYDIQHRDTSYQDKIADLATDDATEDQDIAQKLVDFKKLFHPTTLIKN